MAKNGWGDEELLEILVTGGSGKREGTCKKIQKWFQIQGYEDASLRVDSRQRKIILRGDPQGSTAAIVIATLKAYAEACNGVSIGTKYDVQQAMPKADAVPPNREGLTARIDKLQGDNVRLHSDNSALSQENSELSNENAANQEHTKRLEGLLEKERAKLKELAEQKKATKVININARQDGSVPMDELYIGYMKASCVPQVKWISEAYAKVLKKLDVTPDDFETAAKTASQPLEENPDYAKALSEKEKAEKQKRNAKKFVAENDYARVDIELMEMKIAFEAKLRKLYAGYQKIVRFMRSTLGEHRIPILVTSEKTATATNINVVLPIESGADSHGALEKDIIGHAKDVLGCYMMKKVGRYRTTERNGLMQFTFATRSEKPKELEAEIVNSLFEAQRGCLFSHIGFRTEITVAEDTSSWSLEEEKPSVPRKPKVKIVKKLPFKTEGIPETYQNLALAAREEMGLNLPSPRKFIKVMKEEPLEKYAAIMMACIGEDYHTSSEIEERAIEILQQAGLSSEMHFTWGYLNRLRESGILVVGEKRKHALTYRLSGKFMAKPGSKLEDTVAKAHTETAPSNKLGFKKEGVPKTYVNLATSALEEGLKLPNPRKFTSRRHKIPLEKYAAIMMACAEGYLTQAEIEEKAGQILDKAGLGKGKIKAWWYLENLCNKKILLVAEEKIGNAFTYKLADKFRNKPIPKE